MPGGQGIKQSPWRQLNAGLGRHKDGKQNEDEYTQIVCTQRITAEWRSAVLPWSLKHIHSLQKKLIHMQHFNHVFSLTVVTINSLPYNTKKDSEVVFAAGSISSLEIMNTHSGRLGSLRRHQRPNANAPVSLHVMSFLLKLDMQERHETGTRCVKGVSICEEDEVECLNWTKQRK